MRLRTPPARQRRAFGLVELLVALVLFAVTTGTVALVSQAVMRAGDTSRVLEVAGITAHRDLEMAKITGWANLPLGTVQSTGARATGRWTGPIRYYDGQGVEVSASQAPQRARYRVQRFIDDDDVSVWGTTYTLQPLTIRRVRAEVRRYPENSYLFTYGTLIVRGGI
jgi:type II secretory pathway pseudopilin PulG